MAIRNPAREWLRTSEVAAELHITPVTVRYRAYQRGVEPLRVHGRLLLINRKDVPRLDGRKALQAVNP